MKKTIKLFIIVAILFLYNSNVNASTVTWKQITDKWKDFSKDYDEITTTSDDNNLKIEINSSDKQKYEYNFKYNDNKVELVPFDKSNMTEEEIVVTAFGEDVYSMYYMLEIICELYDIDYEKLDLSGNDLKENLKKYGITYDAEEISYKHDDEASSVSLSAEIIKEFSIDLNKFEETTADLVGTYNEEKDNLTLEDPTVSLSLEKANIKSLDLIVKVNNLPESSTAKCNIYLIPEKGTAFDVGDSYVIGTIDNCKNGDNKYTISSLKENSKYKFQVELIEELSFGVTNQIVGTDYVTFSTITEKSKTDEELKENSKTGSAYIYVAIISLIVSAVSFILMKQKLSKNNI